MLVKKVLTLLEITSASLGASLAASPIFCTMAGGLAARGIVLKERGYYGRYEGYLSGVMAFQGELYEAVQKLLVR